MDDDLTAHLPALVLFEPSKQPRTRHLLSAPVVAAQVPKGNSSPQASKDGSDADLFQPQQISYGEIVDEKSSKPGIPIIAGCAGTAAALVLVCLGLLFCYLYRRRRCEELNKASDLGGPSAGGWSNSASTKLAGKGASTNARRTPEMYYRV
jgi:hypothetical protein